MLGYNPVNDRIIFVRILAKPVNITFGQKKQRKRDMLFAMGDQNVKVGNKNEPGSSIQDVKTFPGAECDTDHQLLIFKAR